MICIINLREKKAVFMMIHALVPNLYAISSIDSNAFLLDAPDGLTLIDTGFPRKAAKVLQVLQALGKKPEDITNILVTHCHPDHAGSLKELKRLTGATAFMHPLDADIIEMGQPQRPMKPSPGVLNALLFKLFIHNVAIERTVIEHKVQDGDVLDIAGGIRAVHVPGHCAGQLAFLWSQHGGVLFAADTAANLMGLGWSIGYEDIEEGKRSLAKIADLSFEVACFGHGKSITQGASQRIRQKFTGASLISHSE